MGIKYDPGTGIYGMDFYVHLSRPGSRVKNRKLKVGKVGAAHKLRKDRQYLDLPNMCLFFCLLVGFFFLAKTHKLYVYIYIYTYLEDAGMKGQKTYRKNEV